jgi:hypothetical protein
MYILYRLYSAQVMGNDTDAGLKMRLGNDLNLKGFLGTHKTTISYWILKNSTHVTGCDWIKLAQERFYRR